MIKVGIAGIGFMGMTHYLAYEKLRGVKVAALCEQDTKRLAGDWRTIKGNFGSRGKKMDLSKVSKYSDLSEMVADPTLDYIDICLPPAAHASTAIAALKAGKHVFCEKPIALTAADAKKMVATAVKAKRQLMIGHVLPFYPEYKWVYQAINGGKYGKLLGGHFKRITADPAWLKAFWDPNIIGGPLLDLHVHDAHFIRLLFGMPKRVFSTGRMRGELVEFFTSQFLFDDPCLNVTATSGAINQQGRSFTHGFEIHLEKATFLFDFSVVNDKAELSMPLTVVTNNGKTMRPKLGDGDPTLAFGAELAEVVKAIRTGKTSPILGADLARDAVVLCHKQTQSVKTGRIVKV